MINFRKYAQIGNSIDEVYRHIGHENTRIDLNKDNITLIYSVKDMLVLITINNKDIITSIKTKHNNKIQDNFQKIHFKCLKDIHTKS